MIFEAGSYESYYDFHLAFSRGTGRVRRSLLEKTRVSTLANSQLQTPRWMLPLHVHSSAFESAVETAERLWSRDKLSLLCPVWIPLAPLDPQDIINDPCKSLHFGVICHTAPDKENTLHLYQGMSPWAPLLLSISLQDASCLASLFSLLLSS